MQGNKTHQLKQRQIQDGETSQDWRPGAGDRSLGGVPEVQHPEARQSEPAVSRGGMNQESRDHNKHNNPGQSGHGVQKHSPAEEKH